MIVSHLNLEILAYNRSYIVLGQLHMLGYIHLSARNIKHGHLSREMTDNLAILNSTVM